MAVRFDDLPKSMQDQIRAKTGEPAPKRKDRRGDSKAAIDGWCFTCREHFTRERDWEAHTAANPGHRRLELSHDELETP